MHTMDCTKLAADSCRLTTDLFYIASDHLSSASLMMDTTGTTVSEQRYLPFGEVRDTPIFSHQGVSILAPVCQGDMDQPDCEATGGTWHCDRYSCICRCP
jgi:hypothetical protein